ncbi:hypothetical protein GYMLUDRAFT_548150 [Collybiopsis luxurians FD-317 M1]|nr:hypothetical protein GYMLUDRAFT_548150 [Collybiopsis luxurians FD-317 M1]
MRRLFQFVPAGTTLALTTVHLQGWDLSDPITMCHFGRLSTLCLENCSLPRGGFWTALRSMRTTLVDLTIDHVDDFLIVYLKSYTGLRRFTLSHFDARPSPVLESVINKLFISLMRHADTLQGLTIKPRERGRAEPPSDLVSIFAPHLGGFHSLASLAYAVPSEDSGKDWLDNILGLLIISTENLRHLEGIYIMPAQWLTNSRLVSYVKLSMARLAASPAFQDKPLGLIHACASDGSSG